MEYEWKSGQIFPQELVVIICAGLDTGTNDDDDAEMSAEVDNMVDVMYENETDDEAD